MADLRYGAIVEWPRKLTTNRRNAPFKSTYDRSLRLLRYELERLEARNAVIQVAVKAGNIIGGGASIRSDSVREHPGVILSFDTKDGPFSYPCDTFRTLEDNVRAIALTLEHLRAVNRYGVTQRGEQYRGFSALPMPRDDGALTREEALELIVGIPAAMLNEEMLTPDFLKSKWRERVQAAHPDKPGGDAELFKRVQRARDVLAIDVNGDETVQ